MYVDLLPGNEVASGSVIQAVIEQPPVSACMSLFIKHYYHCAV